MKVRELKEKLSKLDDTLEVFACSEEDNLFANGHNVTLFDVLNVTLDTRKRVRINGVPHLSYSSGEELSVNCVTLEITSDL